MIDDGNSRGVSVAHETAVLYERFAQRVNEDVAAALRAIADGRRSGEFRLARASQLARSIQDRLVALGRESTLVIEPGLQASVRRGIREADRQLRDIGLEAQPAGPSVVPVFARVDADVVDTFARDSVARMLAGARNHGQRAEQVFRTMSDSVIAGTSGEVSVNRAIADGLASGDPRIADRAIRDLFRDPSAPEREGYRKLGNKLIQVGRATLSVRNYAELVAVTRAREATESARHTRLADKGVDLVQITGRNSRNFCTRFLGLVCTLGPARDNYPSVSELPSGGPPFHPRCSKSTAAYIEVAVSAGRRSAHARAIERFRSAQASGTLTDPVSD